MHVSILTICLGIAGVLGLTNQGQLAWAAVLVGAILSVFL